MLQNQGLSLLHGLFFPLKTPFFAREIEDGPVTHQKTSGSIESDFAEGAVIGQTLIITLIKFDYSKFVL